MRVRELRCGTGDRLRVSLEEDGRGGLPLVRMTLPCDDHAPTVLLDGYGADLLSGFLMSARLAGDGALSDEVVPGDYGVRMTLLDAVRGSRSILLDQDGVRLAIPQRFWDRLFAEFMLMRAHGRGLAAPGRATGHAAAAVPRLLH